MQDTNAGGIDWCGDWVNPISGGGCDVVHTEASEHETVYVCDKGERKSGIGALIFDCACAIVDLGEDT